MRLQSRGSSTGPLGDQGPGGSGEVSKARTDRNGRQSLETTRKNVWDLAGGVDCAVWRRSDSRGDDPSGRPTYSREVSAVRLSGARSEETPAGSGRRGDAAGAVPGEVAESPKRQALWSCVHLQAHRDGEGEKLPRDCAAYPANLGDDTSRERRVNNSR